MVTVYYDIWHMRIDERMQERGYGSKALERIVGCIKSNPFGNSGRIALTCKNNFKERRLYKTRAFSSCLDGRQKAMKLSRPQTS